MGQAEIRMYVTVFFSLLLLLLLISIPASLSVMSISADLSVCL